MTIAEKLWEKYVAGKGEIKTCNMKFANENQFIQAIEEAMRLQREACVREYRYAEFLISGAIENAEVENVSN